MSDFQVTVKEVDSVVVIATDGYLNNIGGEKISEVCDEYMDKGRNTFLINLEKSTVVNSIGVSILIEIIEKLQENDADRETIKNKGYKIGIGCRADTNFNLTE